MGDFDLRRNVIISSLYVKIDWWVDFICASPSGFSCDKIGSPGRRASAIFNPWMAFTVKKLCS